MLTGQSVHTALPMIDLYLPAAHAEHAPPSGPVNPTLQVLQADSSVAPVVVVNFANAQSVHAAEPLAILYFPATHAVHGPLFVLVNPGLQLTGHAETLHEPAIPEPRTEESAVRDIDMVPVVET